MSSGFGLWIVEVDTEDCNNLIIEDIAPLHSDIFDHPDYKYVCSITGKEVVPCVCCNEKRCKRYSSGEKN